jgi:hypothetical protein
VGKRRVRKLFIWSAVIGVLTAYRNRKVAENERRLGGS